MKIRSVAPPGWTWLLRWSNIKKPVQGGNQTNDLASSGYRGVCSTAVPTSKHSWGHWWARDIMIFARKISSVTLEVSENTHHRSIKNFVFYLIAKEYLGRVRLISRPQNFTNFAQPFQMAFDFVAECSKLTMVCGSSSCLARFIKLAEYLWEPKSTRCWVMNQISFTICSMALREYWPEVN